MMNAFLVTFVVGQRVSCIDEQVCSNKDASKEREEDRIAERYLPNLIAVCLLQIVCRYIAGRFQVIGRLSEVGYPDLYFSNISKILYAVST